MSVRSVAQGVHHNVCIVSVLTLVPAVGSAGSTKPVGWTCKEERRHGGRQHNVVTTLMFANFLIAFWRVKVLFQVPHEPLAPLWVARLCRAKYCKCNCMRAV
jgi:hypothetical protein